MGERVGMRGIPPEQCVIEIHLARHVDGVEADTCRRPAERVVCGAGALPFDAIPDRAGIAGPALGPELGKLHRHPAFGGAHAMLTNGFGCVGRAHLVAAGVASGMRPVGQAKRAYPQQVPTPTPATGQRGQL
ncbi:hypothetical protein SDC9_103165 [bioreactor metagenome]|uniref:Uncharacterized protein n=1 Tax=bioreactor metagenome TaxID=1076179 RepID=A0A645AZM9_9ZZZZ